jgi:hypothetical protein
MGVFFRTSKSKNDINYIKFQFSHRFEKVCRWLNMYYSNIRILIFSKITTMSIWITLYNLIWIYKECIFYHYWAIILCIHPLLCCYLCMKERWLLHCCVVAFVGKSYDCHIVVLLHLNYRLLNYYIHYYNSWFFLLGFLIKKYQKSDRHKKNYLVNFNKPFCTCPLWLGSQIGPSLT